MVTRIVLRPEMFTREPRLLLSTGYAELSAHRYGTDVAAVRLVTDRTELVWLPFHGQQIWRYTVDGEDLTMRTHFDEPTGSTVFEENYGAFLLHCGLTGIGHPSAEDTHALHGELPHATYDEAEVVIDDPHQAVSLTGSCRLRRTHSMDVVFRPTVTVTGTDPLLRITAQLQNLRQTSFSYSYMCHINYPVFDGSRLEQSLELDGDRFRLVPDGGQDDQTAAYTASIAADPEVSNSLSSAQPITPEYCAIIRPRGDADGWARFLQVRPDSSSAYVGFDTRTLPMAVRWISNTGDESAAGFCLPSTSHHLGRSRAEADGLMRDVPGGAEVTMTVETGLLNPEDTEAMRARIRAVVDRATDGGSAGGL